MKIIKKRRKSDSRNKNNSIKNEEIENNEEEKKKNEEKLIEEKLNELKEREKKLLEKKSEVIRRYLSENVMPLLAKGVLNICKNMPDDPVEELANFLLENRFNEAIEEKKKKEEK